MVMTSESKMLLYDWIIFHLDQNSYEEMRYTNKEKTEFQVPWTHRSNRKWNDKVGEVFKAWATYKGKEDEDFNFTRAKTNFRMALKYQPNIREVKRSEQQNGIDKSRKSKSLDESKKYKIYKIVECDPSSIKKPRRSRRERSCAAAAVVPEISSPCSSQPSISSQPGTSTSFYDHLSDFPSASPVQIPPVQPQLMSFDGDFLAELGPNGTADFLENLHNCPPGSGVNPLPPFHEVVGTKPSPQVSVPYGHSSRYLPLQPIYEKVSDFEVSSTDESSETDCSSSPPSNDPERNFSLYSFATWCQDLSSDFEVSSSTNSTDDNPFTCFSDMEAFQKMETYIENFLVRTIQ